MREIQIDNEFKNLLPPLTEEQKVELEKDILKNGCLDPLILWNDILIDGHHRYEICTRNNIPFDLIEMDFKDKLEAMQWIWSNQKNRRNLNKYELAQIALKFKPVIEAKAKENQKSSGQNFGKGSQKSAEPIPDIKPVDTREEIAKIAGVSHDTISKVEVIEEQATDDIKEQLKAGQLTINNAYTLTKSAIEAKTKNDEKEKEYAEQLEKEKQQEEEKKRQREIEKSLPENAVMLDQYRKPEIKHIFSITDFNNLSMEQLENCLKHAKRYQDTISRTAELNIDEDSLKAWSCTLEKQEEVFLELSTIEIAIQNLINIQNYFKGVQKNV